MKASILKNSSTTSSNLTTCMNDHLLVWNYKSKTVLSPYVLYLSIKQSNIREIITLV